MLLLIKIYNWMFSYVKEALIFFALISIIFITGYYRGCHETENRFKADAIEQATKNAHVITELETENNKRLTKIESDRTRLLDGIHHLRHNDCTNFGADFGVLYNQSITGAKPTTAQTTGDFSTVTDTIIKNDLTCRALLSEYTVCYQWTQSYVH